MESRARSLLLIAIVLAPFLDLRFRGLIRRGDDTKLREVVGEDPGVRGEEVRPGHEQDVGTDEEISQDPPRSTTSLLSPVPRICSVAEPGLPPHLSVEIPVYGDALLLEEAGDVLQRPAPRHELGEDRRRHDYLGLSRGALEDGPGGRRELLVAREEPDEDVGVHRNLHASSVVVAAKLSHVLVDLREAHALPLAPGAFVVGEAHRLPLDAHPNLFVVFIHLE